MLNQWGIKVGGPVTPWLKDKVFFFFAYDEFRLPEQQMRTRVILTPRSRSRHIPIPDGRTGELRSVNMLAIAAARNNPSDSRNERPDNRADTG